MLFILGITMIIVFTFLIMSKRMSPIVALTLIPIIFAVIGGFGKDVGSMMLEGIKLVASSAALLLFAILFFGILFCSSSHLMIQLRNSPANLCYRTQLTHSRVTNSLR